MLSRIIPKLLKSIRIRLFDLCYGLRPDLLLNYVLTHKKIKRSMKRRLHLGKDTYKYYDFKYRWFSSHWLKSHKKYFSRGQRGFGERPFHAAWNDIFKEFKPRYVMEIGVYRGQIISLWKLIADKNSFPIEVYGITPLENMNDSVSTYIDIDYEQDIKENFNKFNLSQPNILRARSTDMEAKTLIASRKWDLIYIDGNHDYDIVLQDYRLAHANLKKHGILCFDDSSLFMKFEINGVFKGHEGPSRIVSEFAQKEMQHLMTIGHNNFFMKI